ncbi:MAG: hypothetical protein ABIH69_06820 [bacterium]
MMKVAGFKRNLMELVGEVGYIKKLEIIAETANTLKVRLVINDFCFIQVYVNFKKRLKNYVLILHDQRVYGKDCDAGRWHEHPWRDPEKHIFKKEVPLKVFFFEVYNGLRKRNLL